MQGEKYECDDKSTNWGQKSKSEETKLFENYYLLYKTTQQKSKQEIE